MKPWTLGLGVIVTGLNTTAFGQTSVTVNSLTELRTYASMDNVDVTLSAGEYWLQGDGENPVFLDFSGANSTFDLSAAQIRIDTRDLHGYGPSDSVYPVRVTGNGNQLIGLDLEGVDVDVESDPNSIRFASRGSVYVTVAGNDNTFQDVRLVPRGSTPYGLGDVFGKGGRPETGGLPVEEGGTAWITHRKSSAFLVHEGATNTVVDNLNLTQYTYGHGFVVQTGATNTTIRNSTLTGELCQANDIIAHPEYQEYLPGADGVIGTDDDGGTRKGTTLWADTQLSCHEDGIRLYGDTHGLTVENTVVTNFRSGVHSTFGSGPIVIDGVEAYGTENAFVPGSNTTITNSKADIVNGPAVYVQYNGKSNTTIDVEIVGDVPVGVDWAVAYLNGNNFDVTIRSDLPEGFLPEDSLVRFGQTWFNNWRDDLRPTTPEEGDPGPFTNSTFTNLTNEYTVLGNAATGNTGSSQAPVITNGKDNAYDGISLVLSGTHVVLTNTSGLGNNGRETGGDFSPALFESNASVVEDGATLEIQSGIRISDEKLTITGDGIDGKGALYSEGTVNSDTRFGSSNSSDNSAVFLDGDASIGVGVAGQQLNLGGINGTGTLTKRGAGILTIGKPSTHDGDLVIAEGRAVVRPGVVHRDLNVANGASISPLGSNAYNTMGTVYLDGEMDLNGRSDANSLTHQIGQLIGGINGVVNSSNPTAGMGGTLEIAGDSADGLYLGTIEGLVSLDKTGANTQTFSGTLTHTGTTSVTGGTLLINGTHTGGGAYTVGGTGTLGGSGDIGASVVVNDGGTLSPGNSPGILTLDALTLNTGSSLAIEIGGHLGGSDYDRVNVGTATLGGDLDISLLGLGSTPFLPDGDDSFLVLFANSLAGSFDNVASGERVDTEGGEGSFVVTYGSGLNYVLLSDFASSLGLAGDYNGDGFVSQSDLDLVLLNWGDTVLPGGFDEGALPGGGSFDGLVSQNELDGVLLNWGDGTPPSVNAIPEPGSLAVVAGALALVRRRR